mgnify:CR=1 FL=1
MSIAGRQQVEPHLSPGDTVGDASVEDTVAFGGTATVYHGVRPDGSSVAIKVGRAASASPRTEHRFRNEARLSNAVAHPSIVRSLAVGQLDGPPGFEGRMFVLSPFIEGTTLSSEIDYGGMPEHRARAIAKQLLDVLHALHDAGIVHRDIKPANLIIDEADRLHLIDFGLAYALGTETLERTDDVTLKGVAPGTTSYMSPQQFIHAEASPSFDIFSFGATLFELLSGSPPEHDLSEQEVAARRRSADWSPPPLNCDASAALIALTMRCLAYEPQRRPSIEELLAFFDDDADETVRIPLGDAEKGDLSNPTMLMRRPPVIAVGSRPAGDETMAKLVRDKVDLPSVQQIHADILPLDPVSAPRRRVETNPLNETNETDLDTPPDNPSQLPLKPTRHARPGARAAVLVAVVVLLSVGAWLAFAPPTDAPQLPERSKAAPAALASPTPTARETSTPTAAAPERLETPRSIAPTEHPETPAPTTAPDDESAPEPPPVKRYRPRKHKSSPRRKPDRPGNPTPIEPPKTSPPSEPQASADELRAKAKGPLRAGRYDDCMALANKTRDAELVRITSMCKRRKDRENDSP